MNNPHIDTFQCPNPRCAESGNRYLYQQGLPFERLYYVQLDATRREISGIIVYRCRRCGYEFSFGEATHADGA